jgi:hypothetical protein
VLNQAAGLKSIASGIHGRPQHQGRRECRYVTAHIFALRMTAPTPPPQGASIVGRNVNCCNKNGVFSRHKSAMRKANRTVGAFVACFAVGASLSILFGLNSRNWIPAGMVVSTVVAFGAFKS